MAKKYTKAATANKQQTAPVCVKGMPTSVTNAKVSFPKTTAWTLAEARNAKATPENTVPSFEEGQIIQLWPGKQSWDNWRVTNMLNEIADVKGFQVLIALIRNEDADFSSGERIGYFYSKDGIHYRVGGLLFGEEGSLYHDCREWSGSTVLRDNGTLQTFYTLSRGVKFGNEWQTEQRLATAIQNVRVSDDGEHLYIDAPHVHTLIRGCESPDGFYYETPEQAAEREAKWPTRHNYKIGSDQTDNNCDRDPHFFCDPKTRAEYLFFEGNTGAGYHAPGVIREQYVGGAVEGLAPTEDMMKANGCVGVIELTNELGTFGIRRAPWLVTNLLTDEIERINVIYHQDHYYLFCVCHGNKHSLNAENPEFFVNRDFLLGWRAKELGGALTPLNGTGVVLTQKSFGAMYSGQMENRQYTYSWQLNSRNGQTGNRFPVVSYANFCRHAETGEIRQIMNAGPSFEIELDGLTSRVTDLMYDILPADDKQLPLI